MRSFWSVRLSMEREQPGVLAASLHDVLGSAAAPIVVDVRSIDDVHAIDRLIPGAIHRPSPAVQSWWRDLPSSRPVVVCDLSGGEQSWEVAAELQRCGTPASYLVAGFIGWHERGLPTRRIVAANSEKWVTREHPKID